MVETIVIVGGELTSPVVGSPTTTKEAKECMTGNLGIF